MESNHIIVTNSTPSGTERLRRSMARKPGISRRTMPTKISLRRRRSYASACASVVQPCQMRQIISVAVPDSRGKTFSKRCQQSRLACQADPAGQQGPDQAAFFANEPEPRETVGGDVELRPADQAVPHIDSLVSNRDGGLARFGAREGEMIGCGEARCPPALKGDRETAHELPDRGGAMPVADPLGNFVREASGHVRFGIGSRNDIDRLDLVRER